MNLACVAIIMAWILVENKVVHCQIDIPQKPYANIDPAISISAVSNQNHWSEVVFLPRKDYTNVDYFNNVQVNCPHIPPPEIALLDWTNASAWTDGKVPIPNGLPITTMKSGVNVIIRSTFLNMSAIYGIITIPVNTSLIFDDEPIILRTRGIKVLGSMKLGSNTCRLKSSSTIILYGNAPASMTPEEPSVKGIYVAGGSLDVHSMVYAPTWTRLAATANASSTIIYLQDVVNWEVGQTIAIMTTSLKDTLDYSETEQRNITAIWRAPNLGANISAIQLNSPLKYKHYGGREYQAEVALLSRRITIKSEAFDSDPKPAERRTTCSDASNGGYPCYSGNGFGGHIMVDGLGQAKFTGVRLDRLGQTNRLGRYPWHIHRVGERGYLSYMKDSLITRSYFRAAAIHRSNNVVLSGNVAFDIIGHAYYLEDGVEEKNTIEFNLGSYVHWLGSYLISNSHDGQTLSTVRTSANLINPADATASPFYITNRFNYVKGNAAIGGWTGFAIVCLGKAIGYQSGDKAPSSRPVLLFDGNSAHSTGFYFASAAGVYMGGHLRVNSAGSIDYYNPGRDQSCEFKANPPSILNNTKAFLVSTGVMNWGDTIDINGLEVADFSANGLQVFGVGVYMRNILLTGRTAHTPTMNSGCTTPSCPYRNRYDVGQLHFMSNATMRNYKNPGIPFRFTAHSDQYIPEMMTYSSKIIYQNCERIKYKYSFPPLATYDAGNSVSARITNWVDLDGTASERGVPTLMGATANSTWWRTNTRDCVLSAGKDLWLCNIQAGLSWASIFLNPDTTAKNSIGRQFCFNDYQVPKSPSRQCPTIGYATPINSSDPTQRLPIALNAKINGPIDPRLGGGWRINLFAGNPINLTIENIQFPSLNSTLLLALPATASTKGFRVIGDQSWCHPNCCRDYGEFVCMTYTPVDSLSALKNFTKGTGFYHDKDAKMLYVQVVGFDHPPPWTYPITPWLRTDPHYLQFFKGGLSMYPVSWNFWITISADCAPKSPGSKYCA